MILVATALLWTAITLPLATGQHTFFYRDVFTTHLPYKVFGAGELQAGRIPATNPTWALGQPFRGNPDTLAFYPGNLLYRFLPFWTAFNLHYALHWLLAMITMWALARELGQSTEAAVIAGLTYAGSGWILSCLTFYNLLVVSAWWPMALLGAARGGRRGVAIGGVAAGLALLGGEPVAATLGLVPLLFVSIDRHRIGRGLATALAVGLLALLVALPQVVATLRILPFTTRGGLALGPSAPDPYFLHPLRLLELLLPLPFGRPGELGPGGYWSTAIFRNQIPFVFTLHCGIVSLLLAIAGMQRRWRWVALSAAGLALAWLAGVPELSFQRWTGGIFRYPEKFLFWTALALPLLAGWGLERVGDRRRLWARVAMISSVVGLLAALSLVANGRQVTAWLIPFVDRQPSHQFAASQVASWVLMLLAAAGLLGASAFALRRRSRTGLLVLQLLALLQLYPLILTDDTANYSQRSEWAKGLVTGTGVLSSTINSPLGHAPPSYLVSETTDAFQIRLAAADLDAAPGVLHGLTYPLAPDSEGLATPNFELLRRSLPRLPWPARVGWFRRLGIEAAVLVKHPDTEGLDLLDQTVRFGVPTYLYGITGVAPPTWWPARVAVAPTPTEALKLASSITNPLAMVHVPLALRNQGEGEVRILETGPDRIEIEVDSSGGIAVIRRAYHPLWQARTTSGERINTLPADLVLLGLEVPPGHHRIILEITAWQELAAVAIALAVLVASLFVCVLSPARRSTVD